MFLELSEILVCPRCRPEQGLIVMVDELDDRRVVAGDLGCPRCEARYPVRRGLVLFRGPAGDAPGTADGAEGRGDAGGGEDASGAGRASRERPPLEAAGLFRGADTAESATRLAALLGLPGSEGPVLLGEGLAALAAGLARRAEGVEVLALDRGTGGREEGGPEEAGPGAVTRIVGASAVDLPFFGGRLAGAAVLAPPPREVRETARVLGEDGRLVLVEPDAEAREAAASEGLEVVADDRRALVAVRRRR